jgi:hypothetical protein
MWSYILSFKKTAFRRNTNGKSATLLNGKDHGRSKKLRCLPVKVEGKTKAEVVACLEKDIRKALAQGYNLKEIQGILAKEGIQAPLSRMEALTGKADGDKEQDRNITDDTAEETAAVSSPISAPLKAGKVNTSLFTM